MASRSLHKYALPQPFSRRATVGWVVIAAILLVAGAYFMFDRLTNGLASAGATNYVPWGIWVVVYIWFSGLAGGLYLIASLVYLLRLPRFAPIARLALGLSVVSLIVSMIFIGIDLGSIRHSLNTLFFFHWSSPLAWEIKAYMFFMAVAVVQFVLVLINDRRAFAAGGEGVPSSQDMRRRGNVNLAIRVLAGVGVATSFVGPPGGTGMFFAAVKTRGLWEGGITSVLFYVMAVVTAAAFLIVAYRLLAHLRGAPPRNDTLVGLARILAASLVALAFCVFFQMATGLLAGDPKVFDAMQVMVSGSLAPLFWAGEIGIGLVVPAALLAVGAARYQSARGLPWLVGAAIAALVGILALRYVFVVAGFSAPVLDGFPAPAYLPTFSEIMVTVFVMGLAVACYGLAVRLLPLERQGTSEGETSLESAYAASKTETTCETETTKEARDGSAAY